MKKKAIKLILFVCGIGVLLLAAMLFTAIFHRYPTEAEIIAHVRPTPFAKVAIDSTQGDIGYFGVTVENEEPFFIETFKQWVFFGESYDWDLTGD